jgi:hypothetical protein
MLGFEPIQPIARKQMKRPTFNHDLPPEFSPLNVLIVQCGRAEHRVSALRVRAVGVDREPRAVSHGDTDVPPFDHRCGSAVRTLERRSAGRRHARHRLAALGKAIVDADRARAEAHDLKQAARNHDVLEEVDHLILVGKVAVE